MDVARLYNTQQQRNDGKFTALVSPHLCRIYGWQNDKVGTDVGRDGKNELFLIVAIGEVKPLLKRTLPSPHSPSYTGCAMTFAKELPNTATCLA